MEKLWLRWTIRNSTSTNLGKKQVKSSKMENQNKENNTISFSIERQFHILKHFYSIDNDYLVYLISKGFDKEAIFSAMKNPGSKFFHYFCSSPEKLFILIKENISAGNFSNKYGPHVYSFSFPDFTPGLGIDNIIDITGSDEELAIAVREPVKKINSPKFKITDTFHVILKNAENGHEIVTIFPGEYAPAIPLKEFQSASDYAESDDYWSHHAIADVFLTNEKAEKIRESESILDDIWKNRYIQSGLSYERALKLADESENIQYLRGKNFALLYCKAIELIQAKDDESNLELLSTIHRYFRQTSDTGGIIKTLLVKAGYFDMYGLYHEGINCVITGLKLIEGKHYDETLLSDYYSQAGFLFMRISDLDESLQYFEKCLNIRIKNDDKPGMAASYNQIGRAFTLKKEFEKGKENYNKSIEIRTELGHKGALAWSYIGMASMSEESGEFDKAISYYQKAIEITAQTNDQKANLICLLGKGKLLVSGKKYEEALILLQNALEISKTINTKPVQYQIHYQLSLALEETGNHFDAYYHFKEFHNIKEEVINNETFNKLKKQQVGYSVEKAEKEAEIERIRNVELKAANDRISTQKALLDEMYSDLRKSIDYAKLIQDSVLPNPMLLDNIFSDSFILFRPRDVVSGDFFWFGRSGKKILITAADCTGHGVPGAIVSMLGMTFINEIFIQEKITDPGKILDHLREKIIRTLKQNVVEDEQTNSADQSIAVKDGMDISMIVIDEDKKTAVFAGANNPLYLIRNKELIEYKGDKMPVAIHSHMENYATHKITLQNDDALYLITDGYPDQFGGPNNKKFLYKRLKEMLIDISGQPMNEQKEKLDSKIIEWIGNEPQTDDITILGIKWK
ncbi:MAG: hypothetical protein A2W91_02095 [Bacteroidetes bacterium GWF2_38_335]|nr:MAG: hypothetical protein A2W91_02095 [Bacteroidetes bacterium GWF2_38_335]OFY80644.1 MAG: hypothetical protein A2281_05110 [Bacteroidetes bacterium RIFOXYA12_FULL_38_20]